MVPRLDGPSPLSSSLKRLTGCWNGRAENQLVLGGASHSQSYGIALGGVILLAVVPEPLPKYRFATAPPSPPSPNPVQNPELLQVPLSPLRESFDVFFQESSYGGGGWSKESPLENPPGNVDRGGRGGLPIFPFTVLPPEKHDFNNV